MFNLKELLLSLGLAVGPLTDTSDIMMYKQNYNPKLLMTITFRLKSNHLNIKRSGKRLLMMIHPVVS
jgi:hypothetical protein